MKTLQRDPCFAELVALREKYGTSEFDRAVKHLNRLRLDAFQRPERIRLSERKRQKLYFRYGGLCHICGEWIDPKISWTVDHFDPNITGPAFNAEANLRPTHPRCNSSKGAKSIEEMAFANGQTVAQYLEANQSRGNE